MKQTVRIELKNEECPKVCVLVDSDCPLGQLYDYSCSLKNFIIQRMKEAEDLEKQRQGQEAKQEPQEG